MSKQVLKDQTLQNICGHSTITQSLIILVSLTKVVFTLEKSLKIGTSLLPSILTIIVSRFQTSIQWSILFKQQSPNLHFILCRCSSFFYLTFFVNRRLQIDSRKAHVTFLKSNQQANVFIFQLLNSCLEVRFST